MTWYPVYVIKPLGYKEDRSILAIWLTIIFVCFHLLLWRSFTCCPFWLEASYKFCWIINFVLPLSKLKCKTLSTILGPIGISSFSKWGVESEVMVSIPCVRELYNYLLGKKKKKCTYCILPAHLAWWVTCLLFCLCWVPDFLCCDYMLFNRHYYPTVLGILWEFQGF